MKKIFILIAFLIVSFTSMAFRGCYQIGYQLEEFIAMMSGDYMYGDNPVGLQYTIYVGSNGKIWRSTGQNNLMFQQIPSGTTQRLNDLRTSNNVHQGNVVIAGNSGTVLFSTNAGANWSIAPALTSSNLYGVDHNSYVYAVGDNGVIVFGSYIGGTWSLRTSGTTRNLKAVSIPYSQNSRAIIVGEKGTILRTTDIGITWQNVSIPDTTINFYDISQKGIYASADIFCAVGSGGRIYKTTDMGATWQQKPSGTTNTLRSVYFHTVDSGVTVGDNGTIRLTTNGGETWFSDSFFNSPSTRNYKSVSFINRANKTFAAMSDSLFIVSEEQVTLGSEQNGTKLPGEFSLLQNYPNPFNPSTKIRFELPKSSFTKLAVFDITGREIETLVSENMHTGTYEYEWNAVNMPSGVYFYKLEADGFTETRKMILIK